MSEIRFYHLESGGTEKVVHDLINKALERGFRILLKLPNNVRQKFYDDWLWRYKGESFIPHGQEGDAFSEYQPIWLSTQDSAPNKAKMALIVEGAELPPVDQYELICHVFDSSDPEKLNAARKNWTGLKANSNLNLSYWKQENGRWAKQNI